MLNRKNILKKPLQNILITLTILLPLSWTPWAESFSDFNQFLFFSFLSLLTILIFTTKILQKKKKFPSRNYLLIIFTFLFLNTLSTIQSPNFLISFFGQPPLWHSSLWHYILLFLMSAVLLSFKPQLGWKLLKINNTLSFITSILIIISWTSYKLITSDITLLTFLSPNSTITTYLLTNIPLSFSLIFIRDKIENKIYYSLNTFLIFWALQILSPIATAITILISLTTWLILFKIIFKKPQTKIIKALQKSRQFLLPLTIACFISIIITNLDKNSLQIIKNNQETLEGSYSYHLQTWKIAPEIFFQNPFFGQGLHTFSNNFAQYKTPAINTHENWQTTLYHPYNEYLNITLNSGLLTIISFLTLLLFPWRKIHNQIQTLSPNKQKISLTLLSSYITILITLSFSSLSFLLWWQLIILLCTIETLHFNPQKSWLNKIYFAKIKIPNWLQYTTVTLIFIISIPTFLILGGLTKAQAHFHKSQETLSKLTNDIPPISNSLSQSLSNPIQTTPNTNIQKHQQAYDQAKKSHQTINWIPTYTNQLIKTSLILANQKTNLQNDYDQALNLIQEAYNTYENKIKYQSYNPQHFYEYSKLLSKLQNTQTNSIPINKNIESALYHGLNIAPNDPKLRFELIKMLNQQENIQKKIQEINNLLKIKPDYYPALLMLSQLQLQESPEKAQKQLTQISQASHVKLSTLATSLNYLQKLAQENNHYDVAIMKAQTSINYQTINENDIINIAQLKQKLLTQQRIIVRAQEDFEAGQLNTAQEILLPLINEKIFYSTQIKKTTYNLMTTIIEQDPQRAQKLDQLQSYYLIYSELDDITNETKIQIALALAQVQTDLQNPQAAYETIQKALKEIPDDPMLIEKQTALSASLQESSL